MCLRMYSRLFCTTNVTSGLPAIPRQFSRQFSFPGKMSSRGSWRRVGESGNRRETVGADGPSPDVLTDPKDGYSRVGGKALQRNMVDIASKHPVSQAASDPVYDEEFPPLRASIGFNSRSKRRTKIDLRAQPEQRLEEKPGDIGLSLREASPAENLGSKEDESLLPTSFGKKRQPFPTKRHKVRQIPSGYSMGAGKTNSAKGLPLIESFDICLSKVGRSSIRNASLNAEYNEKLIEMEHSTERPGQVLRPGMVLLRHYTTLSEQVQIVKKCQQLGIGPGGFYQPGYRDGAKLRLQMMCLGQDWDPQTREYQNQRAVDGSVPPDIPLEFYTLVKRAIQDSHALIEKNIDVSNVEDVLPRLSPNVCIVNFYTTSGRLGLHQDRDESKESRDKGLPVVSFSVGDSAEFLYGDQRDVGKAEKVLLESGDVLIFGGKSRHIFHGVPSIIPNSAPPALLEETNLRPGCLNLTFRQT